LVAIRSFVCEKKRFAQKFTDGQTDGRTDGRTDDGRRAIALAHSWNELKIKIMLMRAATVVQVLQDLLQLFVVAAIIFSFIASFIACFILLVIGALLAHVIS